MYESWGVLTPLRGYIENSLATNICVDDSRLLTVLTVLLVAAVTLW